MGTVKTSSISFQRTLTSTCPGGGSACREAWLVPGVASMAKGRERRKGIVQGGTCFRGRKLGEVTSPTGRTRVKGIFGVLYPACGSNLRLAVFTSGVYANRNRISTALRAQPPFTALPPLSLTLRAVLTSCFIMFTATSLPLGELHNRRIRCLYAMRPRTGRFAAKSAKSRIRDCFFNQAQYFRLRVLCRCALSACCVSPAVVKNNFYDLHQPPELEHMLILPSTVKNVYNGIRF